MNQLIGIWLLIVGFALLPVGIGAFVIVMGLIYFFSENKK